MKPLSEWICDTCRELIEKPEDGYLCWKYDEDKKIYYGFSIVHHKGSSPRGDCFPYGNEQKDYQLDLFTGENGLNTLLNLWDHTEVKKEDFIEAIRRLYVPNYEEARQYFEQAISDGVIEDISQTQAEYTQDSLKRLIKQYSKQ